VRTRPIVAATRVSTLAAAYISFMGGDQTFEAYELFME
jgi:hypothetical protein